MKNLLIAGLVASTVAMSCSTANQAQVARKDTAQLKGTWQITSVDYDRNFAVRPFDEQADMNCFIGSQWVLVPNNGKGSYTLNNGAGCPGGTTDFIFNVDTSRQFSFKKVMQGEKAKNVTAGYFLQLENQTPTSFDLMQRVQSSTGPLNVTYHFQKIN
ncbi:MAG: hypothetical protein EAS48_07585 [Chryseobacterium sp.]|nr:MAG: hypothetical protein EAS48_07585 [Chryseobacterium sp.]